MIITRRYFYKGPAVGRLKLTTDPNLVMVAPQFAVTFDVTFDDAVVDAAAMDEQMEHFGCYPDLTDTIADVPAPFLGLYSPDGSLWQLSVSNLGVLSVLKFI